MIVKEPSKFYLALMGAASFFGSRTDPYACRKAEATKKDIADSRNFV